MNNTITIEMLKAQLDALKAENDALKAKKPRKIRELSFKVSNKGALSVYGLNRFPVTLYVNQWTKLIDAIDSMKAFIEEHKDTLKFEKTTEDKAA